MTAGEIWTLVLSGIAALGVIGVPIAIWSVRMQRRAERRDLELRDVVWSASRYDNDPAWYFEHTGTNAALAVKIDLTIDGRTSTTRFDRVEPNSPIEVEHIWHKDLVDEAAGEERRYMREREAASADVDVPMGEFGSIKMPAFMTHPMPIPRMPIRVEAAFVVTWRSPLGVPDRQERTWTEVY